MRLRFSADADADIDAIEVYTVERFGPRQWFAYAGALEQGFDALLRFPQIGMASRELPPGLLAYRCRSHWICYEVLEDVIEIVAIISRLSDYDR